MLILFVNTMLLRSCWWLTGSRNSRHCWQCVPAVCSHSTVAGTTILRWSDHS